MGAETSRRNNVAARIAELVAEAAKKAEIDIERVIREMARLSFADIRQGARWSKKKAADGTVSYEVDIVASDALTDDAAAATPRSSAVRTAPFASRCTTSRRRWRAWRGSSSAARVRISPLPPRRPCRRPPTRGPALWTPAKRSGVTGRVTGAFK